MNKITTHETMRRHYCKKYFKNKSKSYFTGVIFLTLLFFILFGWAGSSEATNLYVRDGATGGTCSNWGANACDALPSLTAGDTYYVADGSYSGFTVNAANVTIKKATASDYGGGASWQAGYGDGQASFGSINVYANGFTLDGATRNENDWGSGSAYGFKVTEVTSIDDFGSNYCANTMTIRYTNFGAYDSATYSASYPDYVLKGTGYRTNCTTWTISHSYLHNAAHYCTFCANGFNGATVEYSRIQNGWGKEAIRGQIVFKNGTIRHNQFVNACGQGGGAEEGCTAEIALWDGSAGNWDGNKIYGNYFYRTRDENSGGTIVVGGNGSSWAGSPASSTLIYNNTIAGVPGATNTGGDILVNGGTGNVCRNNLGYNIAGTFDVSCSTTSNNQEETSNPFVNYGSGNLHLSSGRAGYAISSPYNTDMDGVTRGGDGNWDIGAYEYVSGGGDTTPPASPTGLTVN